MSYPKGFLWGTATASYQVEGSSLQYGRGECIWHRFSHTQGKVVNGDTGDVACDHYHRYPEDVQIMKKLGVNAYRFSISWPRILSQGTGQVNAEGLDFYDRLVDELLKAEILPFATLYHWDLPQALQDRGGWTNPQIVEWFCEYTQHVTQRLGDRVKHWLTHNEPFVVSHVGNLWGVHAPGNRDLKTTYQVAHHLLLSHGAGIPVIRQNVPDAIAGITLNLTVAHPASNSQADLEAAKRYEAFQNRWFLDPIYKGEYPADLVEWMSARGALDDIDLSAVKSACVPTDFLGVNFYNRSVNQADANDPVLGLKPIIPDGAEITAMGWEVYPDALRELLVWLKENYAPPAIYITENGSAYEDPLPENGIVEDPRRVNYLVGHLDALEKAVEAGVPMAGYFAWSLMDNFEWAEGYSKRFGLHYVDYETLVRYPKRSALVYQDYIQKHIT